MIKNCIMGIIPTVTLASLNTVCIATPAEVFREQMVEHSERFTEFLSSYCLQLLKENRIGYFDETDEFSSMIEIQLNDCEVTTLSEKELTITFQPYKVGGWADGPYSLTVPFSKLSKHIKNKDLIAHIINSLQLKNH